VQSLEFSCASFRVRVGFGVIKQAAPVLPNGQRSLEGANQTIVWDRACRNRLKPAVELADALFDLPQLGIAIPRILGGRSRAAQNRQEEAS
jgi:hypothetical protein